MGCISVERVVSGRNRRSFKVAREALERIHTLAIEVEAGGEVDVSRIAEIARLAALGMEAMTTG